MDADVGLPGLAAVWMTPVANPDTAFARPKTFGVPFPRLALPSPPPPLTSPSLSSSAPLRSATAGSAAAGSADPGEVEGKCWSAPPDPVVFRCLENFGASFGSVFGTLLLVLMNRKRRVVAPLKLYDPVVYSDLPTTGSEPRTTDSRALDTAPCDHTTNIENNEL